MKLTIQMIRPEIFSDWPQNDRAEPIGVAKYG